MLVFAFRLESGVWLGGGCVLYIKWVWARVGVRGKGRWMGWEGRCGCVLLCVGVRVCVRAYVLVCVFIARGTSMPVHTNDATVGIALIKHRTRGLGARWETKGERTKGMLRWDIKF